MSREFVRNIKNAVIKGENQEPLRTNIQNDLLSDGEDVAVRNGDEYHLLTDNIKEITSANSNIVINRTGKNSVELVGRGGDGEGSPDVLIEVIENSKEYIELINPETNHFQIGLTGDFITNIENINQAIADIPEMPDMDNYYTKEEITTIVQGIEVDLSDYYNKEEIDQKFDEINTGDFEQVQSDWNETDDSKKSFIQNKPIIPDPVNLDDYYNKEEVDTKIDGIETGDFEQVQSDWEETDDTKKSFIQNKPEIVNADDFVTKVLARTYGLLGTSKNINNTNLNSLQTTGFYRASQGLTNAPKNAGSVIVSGDKSYALTQLFFDDSQLATGGIYFRMKPNVNASWTSWHEIITTKNIQDFMTDLELSQEQSDWNETDEEKPSFIKNKPVIPESIDLDDYYNKEEINVNNYVKKYRASESQHNSSWTQTNNIYLISKNDMDNKYKTISINFTGVYDGEIIINPIDIRYLNDLVDNRTGTSVTINYIIRGTNGKTIKFEGFENVKIKNSEDNTLILEDSNYYYFDLIALKSSNKDTSFHLIEK